jgi:hypothetical protein
MGTRSSFTRGKPNKNQTRGQSGGGGSHEGPAPSAQYCWQRRLWANFKVIHDLLNVFYPTRDLLSHIFFLLSWYGA